MCLWATGVESAVKNRQKSAAAIVAPRKRSEGPNVKHESRRATLMRDEKAEACASAARAEAEGLNPSEASSDSESRTAGARGARVQL